MVEPEKFLADCTPSPISLHWGNRGNRTDPQSHEDWADLGLPRGPGSVWDGIHMEMLGKEEWLLCAHLLWWNYSVNQKVLTKCQLSARWCENEWSVWELLVLLGMTRNLWQREYEFLGNSVGGETKPPWWAWPREGLQRSLGGIKLCVCVCAHVCM